MVRRHRSIKSKLMTVILTTSATVLFITCAAFFIYEYYSFRKSIIYQLSLVGNIIAANSTASLAFANTEDATEVLASLESEPHLIGGVLYDMQGEVFAKYPADLDPALFLATPGQDGVTLYSDYVTGFYPVAEGSRRLGTLFLISDMGAMYNRFRLYGTIAAGVILLSLLVAYGLSRLLQKSITTPILALAGTAKEVSENTNYSLRATPYDDDEIGALTDAFNQMLTRIEDQNHEITTFNQGLEKKVKERTGELEAAYKEMEAFSYTVSHDLNAPLRHIDSYLTMFLEDYGETLDKEGRKILGAVTRNSQKMRQLIDDLLAFSQVGRKELKKTTFSMDDVVKKICRAYQRRSEERKVEFKVQTLPEVYADATTIRQVWENLISNAYKYSRDKSPSVIEVGCAEQQDHFVFSIKDNGAGFDMEHYGSLFTPFQRLHTMSQFEGTGVGLAIVERIISRHGGKVWADSAPGRGASFFFTLPKVNSQ